MFAAFGFAAFGSGFQGEGTHHESSGPSRICSQPGGKPCAGGGGSDGAAGEEAADGVAGEEAADGSALFKLGGMKAPAAFHLLLTWGSGAGAR